jgi:hypothetical protein
VLFVVGGCILAGSVAIGAVTKKDEPAEPSRRMSLTEAVCDMLNKGDEPDFAFRVARDLANDHPATYPDAEVAARQALTAAQAKGCGS